MLYELTTEERLTDLHLQMALAGYSRRIEDAPEDLAWSLREIGCRAAARPSLWYLPDDLKADWRRLSSLRQPKVPFPATQRCHTDWDLEYLLRPLPVGALLWCPRSPQSVADPTLLHAWRRVVACRGAIPDGPRPTWRAPDVQRGRTETEREAAGERRPADLLDDCFRPFVAAVRPLALNSPAREVVQRFTSQGLFAGMPTTLKF